MAEQDDRNGDYGFGLPVGYRFLPTEKELVINYLINKAIYHNFSASPFQEISATDIYNQPPNCVKLSSEETGFFFIYKDGSLGFNSMQNQTDKIAGDDLGFWQSVDEQFVLDANGNILANKIHLVYFSRNFSSPKETNWRIAEYRLPIEFYTQHNSKEKWAVGKLTGGRDCILI